MIVATGALSAALGGPGPSASARFDRVVAVTRSATSPRPAVASEPPRAAAAHSWAAQAGAFRSPGAAEAHRRALASEMPEMAGSMTVEPRPGGLTRVLVAGLPDRAAAGASCATIRAAGYDCFVAAPKD